MTCVFFLKSISAPLRNFCCRPNLWVNRLETSGKTLEKTVLTKFKNELININDLL